MRVITKLSDIPEVENLVLTIGTFDGVHLGHVTIIERLNQITKSINGKSGLITFDPHPRMILDPKPQKGSKLELLTTIEERAGRLETLGLDYLFIVPFSVDFANQPAEEYISQFLVRNFSPKVIVIGYDHRFGKNRKGDVAMLVNKSVDLGFEVEEISEHAVNNLKLSSTQIRKHLSNGDIQLASGLLGYNYKLSGYVVHGDKRGSEIGFPTANIEVDNVNKLIPAMGVYAAKAEIVGKKYKAMLNIGTRPTFQGKKKTIEIHLLDFDNRIYGERLSITFVRFLRKEKAFGNVGELVKQLKLDKAEVIKTLKLEK